MKYLLVCTNAKITYNALPKRRGKKREEKSSGSFKQQQYELDNGDLNDKSAGRIQEPWMGIAFDAIGDRDLYQKRTNGGDCSKYHRQHQRSVEFIFIWSRKMKDPFQESEIEDLSFWGYAHETKLID